MYGFRVLRTAALLACLAGAAAPASAATIASGDILWAELTPAVSQSYTFEGVEGQRVLIVTSSTNVHPQIYLYAASDPVNAEAASTGGYLQRRVDHRLLASGTYTITVREAGAASGFFGISLAVMPTVPPPASATDPDGGAIASGATMAGTLSALADTDVFQFEGTAGEQVVITVASTSSGVQPDLYLYPPAADGAEGQGYETLLSNTATWHRLDWKLAQTGTYSIVVADNGWNSDGGTYAIALVKIPGGATSATDTDGGAIVSGATMAGQINPKADTDVFQFEGQAGERVIITTAELGYSLQPEIYLYPPACLPPDCTDLPGPTPWEAADTGDFFEHRLEHVLAKSGTYTIVVNDSGLGTAGTYAIALAKIPGAATSASDPDGGTITSGATMTGTLIGQADTDIYQFYGEAGNQVVITTAALTAGPQPEVRVYPPGGGDAEAWTSGALSSYRLEHALAGTGVYTVVVNDSGLNSGDGAYAISLAAIPGSATAPEDTDGGAIVPGVVRYGVFSGKSDTDLFTFCARAGESVTISASNYASSVQPEVWLYGPGGGPAVASATGGVLPNRITTTLAAAGLYTIVTSDWQLDGQGAYQLTLTKSPATLAPGLYAPFPPDASSALQSEPLLRWDAVAGATGYDVYFGSDGLAPLPLATAVPVTGATLPFPEKLLDATYRWRVVAHTAGGDVEGPTWWFTLRSRGIAYSDNFSDGDSTGDPDWFDTIYAGSRIRTWTVSTAKSLLSNALYDTKALFLTPPAPFLTGSIQTSLRIAGKGADPPNAALLFAYDNGGKNYRYVKVAVGKLTVGQQGAFGGDRSGVKLTRVVPFAKDKTYVLKVTADSTGRVRVFRKDGATWKALASYKFKKPMPGYTGYWTGRSQGVFDNYLLTAETILP